MTKYVVFTTGKVGIHVGKAMAFLDCLCMQDILAELKETRVSGKDDLDNVIRGEFAGDFTIKGVLQKIAPYGGGAYTAIRARVDNEERFSEVVDKFRQKYNLNYQIYDQKQIT